MGFLLFAYRENFSATQKLDRHWGTGNIDQAALIELDFISRWPCTKGFRLLLGTQTVGVELQNAPFNLAEAADWKAMPLHLEVMHRIMSRRRRHCAT
jgi:hypothetical protein